MQCEFSGLKRLWIVAVLLLCTATFHTNGAENPPDELLPPHHAGGDLPTPSVWGTQEVEAWLFAEGFGFLRKPFEDAQVNGRTLLAMRDHTLDVEFNLEPKERYLVMEAIGRLRQGILDSPLDLWDWRAANHHDHDTLLAGIVNCPRITILYLYHFEYKKTLQPLFYRDGTGLGFWTSWLLCPRIEIAYYLSEFEAMHPELVWHMWVTAIGSTITESCSWLLLLFAAERLPENERGVDGDIVKSTFSKMIMVVGLWIVHPLMSHDMHDICTYIMLGWPYIGIAMGLFYVKAACATAIDVCRTYVAGGKANKRE